MGGELEKWKGRDDVFSVRKNLIFNSNLNIHEFIKDTIKEKSKE